MRQATGGAATTNTSSFLKTPDRVATRRNRTHERSALLPDSNRDRDNPGPQPRCEPVNSKKPASRGPFAAAFDSAATCAAMVKIALAVGFVLAWIAAEHDYDQHCSAR